MSTLLVFFSFQRHVLMLCCDRRSKRTFHTRLLIRGILEGEVGGMKQPGRRYQMVAARVKEGAATGRDKKQDDEGEKR